MRKAAVFSPRLLRRAGTALAALVLTLAVLAGVLWLALPGLLMTQAEKILTEKSGHHLRMARPEFNPLTLSLRLRELSLIDAQGKPLLAIDELFVDLAARSLVQRAIAIDALHLDGLKLTLQVMRDGSLNWTPLIEALRDPAAPPSAGLPRLEIADFTLTRGHLDIADQRDTQGFASTVAPLDIHLRDVSTLRDNQGSVQLRARLSQGARIALDAALSLTPLVLDGTLDIADIDLALAAPWLKDSLRAAPAGRAHLSARYRLAHDTREPRIDISAAQLDIAALRIPLGDAGSALQLAADALTVRDVAWHSANASAQLGALSLDALRLQGAGTRAEPRLGQLRLGAVQLDLAQRTAELSTLTLSKPALTITRNAAGQIDLLALLTRSAGASAGTAEGTSPRATRRAAGKPKTAGAAVHAAPKGASISPASPSTPWRVHSGPVTLTGGSVTWRDETLNPPAEWSLDDISASLPEASGQADKALVMQLAARLRSGGDIRLAGRFTPAGSVLDADLTLRQLALAAAQPYLAAHTGLRLLQGTLAAQGKLRSGGADFAGPRYSGQLVVDNLRLGDTTGAPLLGWQHLETPRLLADASQVNIGQLQLSGLDASVLIDAQKRLNLAQALASPQRPVPPAQAAGAGRSDAPAARLAIASAGSAGAAASSQTPPARVAIAIDRLRLDTGSVHFADHSLVLPFATHVHGLRGSLAGLSNRPGSIGELELDGAVDDYGQARVVGQINLFDPREAMNLRVQFRNVDMPRLSPYTATFAGRTIRSGKLDLQLNYRVRAGALQADNKIVIDRLTLGERIASPTARELPLSLAIALLEDSNGRIDLGVPLSGDLNDPQFRYRELIWQAIGNVLGKIVSAPFRALGALFGSDESLDVVRFDAGSARLSPPEREKLLRLANALASRPALTVSLRGIHGETDRSALQSAQLRRALLQASGENPPAEGDPGPVSTSTPAIRNALEARYAERNGGGELAALKHAFRSANPGALEQNIAGRMFSEIGALLRKRRTLPPDEVASLKGRDFYTVLFGRLRASEVVADARLGELAERRAQSVREQLLAQGVPAARIAMRPAQAGEADETGVPLDIEFTPLAVPAP